jgi:HD-like signal output (HDOD) protein
MFEPVDIDPNTFLRQHCTLPALPEVVGQIQRQIQGGDADMGKVAQLISGEPALLAQVLKVVNSAYYGLPGEVTNVRVAIAYLGLNEIYRMVLSLSVINTMQIEQQDELEAFWFHSFYASLCTKYLAKQYEPHLSFEELWSASMLHDIGRLVYLKFFPEHYEAIRAFSKEHGVCFSEAERHFSLPSSSFLGALLCIHWRLPDNVRKACELHTLGDFLVAERDGTCTPFQRMISLGNLLAVLSARQLNDSVKQQISDTVRKALDCTEAEFLTIMGDIYELRTEVESFMQQFR